jgi:hypothetical protein
MSTRNRMGVPGAAGRMTRCRSRAWIRRRHAGHFRALAEQADPALRGPGHGQWLERLNAEAGNLAAAVRRYLDHDRGPLPHLFRVPWPRSG